MEGTSSETLVKYEDLALQTKSELISNRNAEELHKVSERVQKLVEYLRHVYDNLVEFVHGIAMLRDLGDGVAKAFNYFGQLDQLPVPTSTNYTMILLGDTVLSIGDKMDSQIYEIETKIFPILISFGSAFKLIKHQIQVARQLEEQHVARRQEYVRFIERTRNVDEQKYTEKEENLRHKLAHAMNQASTLRRKCSKKLYKLEQKKCEDLKKALFKWFQAQASVAAKTLELSTEACRMTKSIDTSGDITKMFKHLNLLDSISSKTEIGRETAEEEESVNERVNVNDPTLLTFQKEKNDGTFGCTEGGGDSVSKKDNGKFNGGSKVHKALQG